MIENAAPFRETDKRQSANRSMLKLPTGSSSHCSVHILPLLGLSNIQVIRWGSNKRSKTLFYATDTKLASHVFLFVEIEETWCLK